MKALISEVIGDLRLPTQAGNSAMTCLRVFRPMVTRNRVTHVLYNLIGNAVKFSRPATTIDISLTQQEKNAVICIQDHGDGIPKQDYEHIFKRFYQVDGPGSKHLAGMGLGLYISDQIIKQQGGRLSVQSEEGRGSTFCVTLPLLTE